jgi:hypothetical protein
MTPRSALILCVVLLGAGCAAGSGGGAAAAGNQDRIEAGELETMAGHSVLEAVQRLRPSWTRSRGTALPPAPGCGAGSDRRTACDPLIMGEVPGGAGSLSQLPSVYLDGAPYGPFEVLGSLGVEAVRSMEFVPPSEAPVRFGGEYSAGVILVRTRRGG